MPYRIAGQSRADDLASVRTSAGARKRCQQLGALWEIVSHRGYAYSSILLFVIVVSTTYSEDEEPYRLSCLASLTGALMLSSLSSLASATLVLSY